MQDDCSPDYVEPGEGADVKMKESEDPKQATGDAGELGVAG